MARLAVYLIGKDASYTKMLNRADRSLARWQRRHSRHFKMAAAAVVGFGVYSVKAYADQEKAERALSSALASHGDAVSLLMPKYKKLASAIQGETIHGDEFTLQLMAQIRNLGVLPDQLEQTTKGAIGLAKALKMDANSAARYAALAMKGEFTVLQRYVPALRTATTAEEKHAIVTELMARGYAQAQDEADTLSGDMIQLKNAAGDVAESIGGVVVQTLTLGKGADGAAKSLQDLAADITTQAPYWAYSFRAAGIEMQYAWRQTWNVASGFFDNVATGLATFTGNFGEGYQWISDNWAEALTRMDEFSEPTWKSMATTAIDIFAFVPKALYRQMQDMYEWLDAGNGVAWKTMAGAAIDIVGFVPLTVIKQARHMWDAIRHPGKAGRLAGVVEGFLAGAKEQIAEAGEGLKGSVGWGAIVTDGEKAFASMNPVDDIAEQIGAVRSGLRETMEAISRDLDLEPPAFETAKYRNLINESLAIDAEKAKKLAALEQGLRDKLAARGKAQAVDAVTEAVTTEARLRRELRFGAAVRKGTAEGYSASIRGLGLAGTRGFDPSQRINPRQTAQTAKATTETAANTESLVGLFRQFLDQQPQVMTA